MTRDDDKTREELITELRALRKQLESSGLGHSERDFTTERVAFEEFFDASPYPASFLDRNLVYQAVNTAYERYLGVKKEEVTGASPAEFLPAETFERVKPHLDRCLDGEDALYEAWFDFPGMGRRYMHVADHPRRNAQGDVVGILHISRDITEHKEGDNRVLEERKRVDTILSALETGLSLIKRDMTVVWCNEKIAQMFPDAHPVDGVCHVSFANKEAPCPECPTIKSFHSGQVEFAERYDETTQRWYKIVAQPVKDAEGETTEVLEGITDITSRKRIEEALARSESKWRQILINVPQIGITLDTRGTITFANDHFLELTGWNRDEVLGKNWFETCVPGNIRDEMLGVFETVMSQRHAHGYSNYENDILHRNGERLTVAWSNVLTLTPQGYPVDVTCMGIDLTERKRAEAALRESQERFRALFASVSDPVLVADRDTGILVECNAAAERFFGRSRERLIGSPQRELHPPQTPTVEGVTEDFKRQGTNPGGIEELNLLAAGDEVRDVEVTASTFEINENRLILGVFRDVTERKRTEKHLQVLADIIKRSQDFIGVAEPNQCAFFVNPAGQALVGLDSDEEVKRTKIEEYFLPEDLPYVENTILPTVMKDGRWAGEFRFRHFKTGKPIPVLYDLFLSANPDTGENTCLSTITRDIADRKSAEEVLKESEARFRALFENAPLAYQSLDENGRFLDVIRKWLESLGYNDKHQVLGRWFGDILAPGYREHFDINFPIFKHACVIDGVEFEMLRTDGGRITVSFNGRVQSDHDGHFMRTHCIFTDITERKQAEEALLRTSRRLVEAQRIARVGDWAWDPATDEVTWSDQMFELLGLNPADHVPDYAGQLAIYHPESAQLLKEAVAEALENGQGYKLELRRTLPDGNNVFLLARGLVDKNVQGRPHRLYGTLQDITERKLAEENLRKSEERFRTLFVEMTSGFALHEIICDVDGNPVGYRFLEVNPAFEALTGLKAEQLLGRTVHEVFPAVSHEWIEMYGQVALIGEPLEFARYSTEVGRWFEVKAFRPSLGQFAVVIKDITASKQAEEALRNSEASVRAILENTPIGIHLYDLVDRRLIFTGANPASDMILGLCHDELIGKDIFSAFPLLEETAIPQRYMEVLDTGVPWHTEQLSYEDSNAAGTFEVLCFKISSKRLAVMFLDITSRKRAEEDMRRAKELAETSSRAKSEFLANMSHEIRTPLNGVLGMLQLLETTEPNDEQKEYLVGAIRSTSRLTRLLSDILDISRIEAGRMEIVEAEFNINETLGSIRELFEMEASGKGLRLEFGRDEDLSQVLIGDEARLRQILFNLVGNAIKFTEKGEIRIDASLLPSSSDSHVRVLVTVRDTGIGIPEEHLKGIFEPFVQAEASYTRRFQGAGLGLSIVRRLVKLLGGDISIDSTPGEGTTFYVSLPFKLPAAEQGQIDQEVRGTAPPAEASLRILVAEDDSVSSLTCKRLLEKSGYSVTIAKDGQEALQRLTEQDFDLILMDVQMPVMDGVEATKTIRCASNLGTKSSIPIIAMTAYAMSGDKETCLGAGMDDYIAKPVDKAALFEVIEKVLHVKEKVQ